MSGVAPYTYLTIDGETLCSTGTDGIIYLYDSTGQLIIAVGDVDLFEGACAAVLGDPVTYPENAYDTNYPYCRTALRYNMADTRGNPQVGSFVPQAPYFAIKLMLDGCDRSSIVSVSSRIEPLQSGACVASLFPGNDPTVFFAVVDMTNAELPIRLYFTVTNGANIVRTFWIGIRDRRDGLITGAVVPGGSA